MFWIVAEDNPIMRPGLYYGLVSIQFTAFSSGNDTTGTGSLFTYTTSVLPRQFA